MLKNTRNHLKSWTNYLTPKWFTKSPPLNDKSHYLNDDDYESADTLPPRRSKESQINQPQRDLTYQPLIMTDTTEQNYSSSPPIPIPEPPRKYQP